MKSQRLLTTLTVVNFVMMVVVLWSQVQPVQASGPLPVLRGSGLEIVDAQGKNRATLTIMPAGPAIRSDGSVVKDGKIYPETVIFRLIRQDGRPSVKITTSEEGSAMSLGGGIDPAYIVISADGGNPELELTNKDRQEKIIKP